jgi:hypothetical protein
MFYDPMCKPSGLSPYNPTTAAILLKAAELIETHGHTKRCVQDDRGRICMMGAINMAITGNAGTSSPLAEECLGALPHRAPVSFNDGNLVTKEDVIYLLRIGAKLCMSS